MKVNFNSLSFKSKLLVDNRAKVKGLKGKITPLKDDFSKSTAEDNNTLILTTVKDSDRDSFILVSESGNVIAKYDNTFSKYIQTTPFEHLVARLINIYKLMQLQASYNSTEDAYKSFRSECLSKIKDIKTDEEISEFQKLSILHFYKKVIKDCNKSIDSNAKSKRVDCESFEISHGLKEILD